MADDFPDDRTNGRQIEAELLRRHQAAYPEASDSAGGGGASSSSLGPHRPPAKKLKTVAGELVDQVPLDFFGRPIVLPPLSSTTTTGGDFDPSAEETSSSRFRIFYRFHEGSSTAVRKPLKMSALF